ncbi:mating contact stabilization protein TraG [Legionella donaldsonii]|uniref:Mating contact stabilization protein TraG n=1 Tax=Legionella donaldsonii TaxID=45060 RepID=A0A378J079_9GAMM|nr:conjugal transfer mating-pair stabilization protein TraG [Legionella donaldsonii]STX41123.1 mating contact stabilization protein TraG [Legionella donaldsonii]
MSEPITIHVLAAGDLFEHVLTAMAAFTNQQSFASLLRLTALIGIVMAAAGFLKSRDPFVFARWFLGYMLMVHGVLLPKTTVMIDDVTAQNPKVVDHVPVVFALSASLLTTVGLGLAQIYDSLLYIPPPSVPDEKSMPYPEDLLYTQTGMLFGSRLVQAAKDFRITDPMLKEEMNAYFRSCVVGDIRINQKYSVAELTNSPNIWALISAKGSPLRRVKVNGQPVSCLEASKAEGEYSLKQKLDAEIKKAYTFFGINFFGKPANTTYESLFKTHLQSAFNYYQGLSNDASDIFLQSMMINAMRDGHAGYQTFTDSTAGLINQQYTKAQVQHRFSWEVLGQKALWILPITHTCLTLLLFGLFPLVLVLATLPQGMRIVTGYLQFFLSLQFWPVLFAILNVGMTMWGAHSTSQYGSFTMVNLDKIDELHADISGVCGYLMMMIPFLSHGLVSNLGGAFSNLATSMMSHMQGSSMSVAGEAASASFSLGQTSFYNTSANNFSANKHDSNWTNLHGMRTSQTSSGVLKTITGSGEAVFDASPAMSRGALSINTSDGLNASLNEAYEQSTQAARSQGAQLHQALSTASHRLMQLSSLSVHDFRLGAGVSDSESGQYSKALSTINHIASDVAARMGVSKEDAVTHLTNFGLSAQASMDTRHSIGGKIAHWGLGISAKGDTHLKFDRSTSASDRYHSGSDGSISARESRDFNDAFNTVKQFTQSHHFDDSHSKAASLSNQLGADLRQADTASHNLDASLARASRVSEAKAFVETHSTQINTDLNQAFPAFVASQIGEQARDALFSKPGDLQALNRLQHLGEQFIVDRRDALINEFGTKGAQEKVNDFYQRSSADIEQKGAFITKDFNRNSEEIARGGKEKGVGFDKHEADILQAGIHNRMHAVNHQIKDGEALIKTDRHDLMGDHAKNVVEGKDLAQRNTALPEKLNLPKRLFELHKDKGE